MKVPLSWLAEYVELPKDATPHDVMEQLVRVGLEEESAIGGEITGPVVVGKVLEFVEEEQSNGKTIRWCQVQVGPKPEDVRGIVCGARNFEVGDKVVVTLPGAVLPGGFEIAARKTYGHISDGMIASAKELSLSDDHDGILRLVTMGLDPELGSDALELLGLNEAAAEVNVTPDRGYCFSIRGIAREYSHATKAKFTDPASQVTPAKVSGFDLKVADSAPIHGTAGCSNFLLVGVEGIDATSPTPSWMANRLKLAGMRSISIAVDITNYVMLEMGQPLHAYDLDWLTGGIEVRRAKKGEKITTLDDRERILHEEDLLITDESGPIGIAGVMGGASTEVSDATTKILLEAAIFDPISIARSARRHKLPSEASRRFERGVDHKVSAYAAARAAQLLVELAGGKLSGLGAEHVTEMAAVKISMDASFPSALVGYEYEEKEVVAALEMIGCKVSGKGSLAVEVPSWRPDLRHKTDLAEEVARLVGYDKIPATIPVAPPGRGLTRKQQLRRKVLGTLVGGGFVEVLNYPFYSPEQNSWFSSSKAIELENPIQSEAGQLRKELLPGLLQAASRNVSRANSNLAIVEEGSAFMSGGTAVTSLPVGNERPSDKVLASLNASIPSQPRKLAGVVLGDWVPQQPGQASIEAGYQQAISALFSALGSIGVEAGLSQVEVMGLHPGRGAKVSVSGKEVGIAGELHPDIADELHLPGRVGVFEVDLSAIYDLSPELITASEIGVMPAATQDLSLVVGLDVSAADLVETIEEGAGELLESISLVDDWRSETLGQKKSLTFSMVFRAKDKTLTAAEATAAKEAAVQLAAERHGAELRA
ncbi:phenylalanine--tRNA ligase subunit beta [Aquiluna sp.]|nr:phenylalanine--tRNA ligase subunit beta [Aquiluna sp.]